MTVELISNEAIIMYPIIVFVGFAFSALVLASIFGPSKSKTYRQDLSNMYVAGKIRQIAEKDEINLSEEFSRFAKMTKHSKIDIQSLDSTIERELQEKIAKSDKVSKE